MHVWSHGFTSQAESTKAHRVNYMIAVDSKSWTKHWSLTNGQDTNAFRNVWWGMHGNVCHASLHTILLIDGPTPTSFRGLTWPGTYQTFVFLYLLGFTIIYYSESSWKSETDTENQTSINVYKKSESACTGRKLCTYVERIFATLPNQNT